MLNISCVHEYQVHLFTDIFSVADFMSCDVERLARKISVPVKVSSYFAW